MCPGHGRKLAGDGERVKKGEKAKRRKGEEAKKA
jgi:hypothetical protein